MGTPTSSGTRFRILRPHEEGGLGKVSVALDAELHREVALKEIKERFADHSESRARFLREAEITGGLEHPGIVPVYGLGQYADGRPFYAMRFIRGDSLKDAIERFHASSPLSPVLGGEGMGVRGTKLTGTGGPGTAVSTPASVPSPSASPWAASSTSATPSVTPTAAACCTAT